MEEPDNHQVLVADRELAQRLENTDAQIGLASAKIHVHLHPESGAAAELVAGGYAVFTGVGSPFTQALGVGMNGPVTESDMDRLEEFFLTHGSAAFLEVCPLADPTLIHLLGLRGYRLKDCTNLLVKRLDPFEAYHPPVKAVEVRRCTPDEAEIWARTVIQGFAEEEGLTPQNLEMVMSLFHSPQATCVLAWMEDKPVGGGALSVYGSIAALYGASTIAAFRRHGVQSAIIEALNSNAVTAHCTIAYTLTQPGSASQRNLERQNFRVAYTRFLMTRELFPSQQELR